jgi:uncharacterized protein (UPF0147 family)
MSPNRTAWSPIVVGLMVLCAIPGCQQAPSPADLAQEALQAASAEDQELAAVKLAEVANDQQLDRQVCDEAQQELRRVLGESRSPTVRAACIQGLASLWDYESMPAFLDALDDPSEVVRGPATVSIEWMMSVSLKNFGYDYRGPPATRTAAIERIRQYWEEKREGPIFTNWMKKKKRA